MLGEGGVPLAGLLHSLIHIYMYDYIYIPREPHRNGSRMSQQEGGGGGGGIEEV